MKNILLGAAMAVIAAVCAWILYKSVSLSVPAMATENEGIALPVIMYHNISEKSHLLGTYTVSPEVIESDIKYLLDNGYTTVSCEEVLSYCKGEGELPEKPIMLTVDDGFESFYAYMYPLLKKYGCKAVISPIGSCIDSFTEQEDHNLDYAYLTWEELKEMSDSGLVEIANHTYNLHSDDKGRIGCGRKRGEGDADYRAVLTGDIGKMQTKIKQFTAMDCTVFTYPYGKISDGSEEVLKELGFELVFTCNGKVNYLKQEESDIVVLGRFNRPNGKSTYDFFNKYIACK
jgi:peptidoglycan/xylan/chitin deacetylase (PgdA/CDA1 family)